MRLTRHLGIGIAAALTGWVTPYWASAEIQLTDFNGMWRGSGTDRSSLFDLQGTTCQTKIQADPRRMSSNTVCDGQFGLHKVIDLSVTFDGNQFKGTLSQSTSGQAVTVCTSELKGTVSGYKTEDTAVYQVQFSGLCPNATVNLKRTSRWSYSMHVTTSLGSVMDVVFNRKAPR